MPGTHDAIVCLLAALRTGRLEARALWRKSTQDQPIPQFFWQEGGRFIDHEDGVAARGENPRLDWTGLIVFAEACQALWPAPVTLLSKGALSLRAAIERLAGQPEDPAGFLFDHPTVVVTGLDAAGARVVIDRGVFRGGGIIDPGTDTVTTADGRLCWSAVMVALDEACPR